MYASIYVNLERTIDVYKGIQITDLLTHFRMFRRLIHMLLIHMYVVEDNLLPDE